MDKGPFAMKPLFSCVLTVALLAASSVAQAVELKVLSGNGPRAAVSELCAQFERSTGHKIDLRFGVNPEVKQKIEAGETFDVVIGIRRSSTP
jgi:molybdate transport system substrate-binding protein